MALMLLPKSIKVNMGPAESFRKAIRYWMQGTHLKSGLTLKTASLPTSVIDVKAAKTDVSFW